MADALLGGIIINEILVDPNGTANFDTDGNGTADGVDEYVELYNSSAVAIDISGLELWDAGVGVWFTFPPGTILQPGGHALVLSGVQTGGALPTGGPDDLFFDAGRASPLINNGGDNVVVYDPGADEYISATFNGDALDDPTVTYSGFSATATQVGAGEDFGTDIDGFSIQRQGDGADTFVNNQAPTPGTSNVCFARGSAISTPDGPVAVEDLIPGMLVDTLDHGPRPVRWVFAFRRDVGEVRADARLGGVRFARGSLGHGLPRRSLIVSRQHRILIRSLIAQRMFDAPEVLVAAKDLIGAPGVTSAPLGDQIVFYHLLMAKHEVILAEGAPTESLYLGPETLGVLSAQAQKEITGMPDCLSAHAAEGPARPLVKGARARRLLTRHVSNNRVFCAKLDAVA